MKQYIFNRVEKKYLINNDTYHILKDEIEKHMEVDQYGEYLITNIYYDNDNYELIRNSIEKPVYKGKLRLRSYGIPKLDSVVYLEIKKKYKNNVNKRRISLKLKDAYNYLDGSITKNTQIEKEIKYILNKYNLIAKIFISYERIAYYQKGDDDLRITFDKNILYRKDDLRLENGNYGSKLLDNNQYLMEIKTNGSFPLWLVKKLSELKISPVSFSKYGQIYKKLLREGMV